MHVFVTGASGWIGSAVVEELLANGHEVTGLVRSDASAEKLGATGATVARGDLDDLDSLRAGAKATDATIHLANKHDWSDPAGTNAAERAAVQTILDVLVGTDKPFLLAAGVAGLAQGRPSTEADASPAVGPDSPRGGTENLALEYADRGIRVVSLRFAPTVHGAGDHGFISIIANTMREQGTASYVGDGANAWAAVHRSDAARVTRLALESAPTGTKVHAVGEEGVATHAIADALGARLELPVQSVPAAQWTDNVPFVGMFWGMDLRASSAATRELLSWTPTGPTLVEDIADGAYG